MFLFYFSLSVFCFRSRNLYFCFVSVWLLRKLRKIKEEKSRIERRKKEGKIFKFDAVMVMLTSNHKV